MFRTTLNTLCAQFGLMRKGCVAYGYTQGCWVTLRPHATHMTLSLYTGALDAAPEGMRSRVLDSAQAIAEALRQCGSDSNVYGLCRKNAVAVGQGGSIVQVRFARVRGMLGAMQRFIAEVLPHVAPLTSPMQCIHCGGITGGMGVPVKIAANVTVPMHAACCTDCMQRYDAALVAPTDPVHTDKAVIASAGVALVMALIWALAYRTWWSGVLLALLTCALVCLAYRLMKGPQGIIEYVTHGVCCGTSVFLGMLGNALLPLGKQYAALGDVVHGMMKFGTYVKVALGQQPWGWIFAVPVCVGAGIVLGLKLRQRIRNQDGPRRPKAMPGQA